jgi:prephenate dehydrogenase
MKTPTMKTWNCVAIVGVGLIGGSLGLALRRCGVARRVVGIGRNAAHLRAAQDRQAVTEWTTDFDEGLSQADLVVVCSPVDMIAEHVIAALRAAPRAVVTDVGSTKAEIVRRVVKQVGREVAARFVGGHPIAGSEQSGVAAARADLFEQRTVVLTPIPSTARACLQTVARLWRTVGARVVPMAPAVHDRLLARTSHLPHVVASALALTTDHSELPFAGTGWADTTRIASGSAPLWRAILMENRRETLRAIDRFCKSLQEFRRALQAADQHRLEQLLALAKKRRDALGS